MITAKDNAKLKLVRALQRKKERDATGLFACEGGQDRLLTDRH